MNSNIEIRSDNFKATISPLGAELKSVIQVSTNTEFMWQADPIFWQRTSPVLFPIVGKVKNDLLQVSGKSYPLTQHGFARDCEFSIVQQDTSKVSLLLISSDNTLSKYPFSFKLILSYEWVEDSLICSYEVFNLGDVIMPFSIGAHPGFNLPGAAMDEWKLVFADKENFTRHLLENGLFNHTTEVLGTNLNELALNETLFDKDAIVFKNLQSTRIKLQHLKSNYGINMSFKGFPFFAVWTKKGCHHFLCLEPWYGCADDINGHIDITKKEGIQLLPSHQKFFANYMLTFSGF